MNDLFRHAESFTELSPRRLVQDPPVLVFDKFLTQEETQSISNICGKYDRSLAGDQVSKVRTSTQCWCYRECMDDPIVRTVIERSHNVTRSSPQNAEYMQIVRYERGQFYMQHHDQNSAPETPQGPRVLTLFMYLNTPKRGGATRFNNLYLDVHPTMGKAVLWTSVSDTDTSAVEPRTHHEALPVEDGEKMGANLWIHMYDWKSPSARGCYLTSHNTFDHQI